jgi:hypothetical protein
MLSKSEFDIRCKNLITAFPRAAPQNVTDETWGDYAEARHAFDTLGSNWDCHAVFINRSVLTFVNTPAYLFLLPRFVSCSWTITGLNADILDYVVFSLRDRISTFATLFTEEQGSALLAAISCLFAKARSEFGAPEPLDSRMKQIETALSRMFPMSTGS